MVNALAARILTWYPEAWRERYLTEVRALLEDVPPRWPDVAELFRGMLIERIRELLTADDKPRRTFFILGLVNPLTAIAILAISIGAGLLCHRLFGGWSSTAHDIGQVGLLVFIVTVPVVMARRRRRPLSISTPPYSPSVGMTFVSAIAAVLAVTTWGNLLGESTLTWSSLIWPVIILSDTLSSIWPTQRMLGQFDRLQVAEQQIKSNMQLAESSREWIARGVPSPLVAAEQQIAFWTRERDAAHEQLRAMGYRARLSLLRSAP